VLTIEEKLKEYEAKIRRQLELGKKLSKLSDANSNGAMFPKPQREVEIIIPERFKKKSDLVAG
jgi:hypothetical protein